MTLALGERLCVKDLLFLYKLKTVYLLFVHDPRICCGYCYYCCCCFGYCYCCCAGRSVIDDAEEEALSPLFPFEPPPTMFDA